MTILTEPKNAMVKQYAEADGHRRSHLTFTKDALRALAGEAVKKARARERCVLCSSGSCSMSCMSLQGARISLKITINRAVVEGKRAPLIRKRQDKDAA